MKIVLIILGSFWLIGGLLNYKKLTNKKKWQKVEGVLVSKIIKQSTQYTAGVQDILVHGFVPSIKYKYKVNDISYSATQEVARGELFANKKTASDVIARYREGDKIWIFYSSTEPQKSFIELESPLKYLVLILLGTLFVVLGIFYI